MIYRFLEFELDEQQRTLRSNGDDVAVQPKVLDLLIVLLWHRARVVPKDVLFRELWPDAMVTEASLTRLVKEARRAVGDDGRSQGVIRTASRRGYRFVAEVATSGRGDDSDEERVIRMARQSLEAHVETQSLELQSRISEFEHVCLLAIRSARLEAQRGERTR